MDMDKSVGIDCGNGEGLGGGGQRGKIGTTKYDLRKLIYLSLAGVSQWIETGPENQRVAILIPTHDTCLGCRPGPQ